MDLTFSITSNGKTIDFELFDGRTILANRDILRYRINENGNWELFIEDKFSLKKGESLDFVIDGQKLSYKIMFVEEHDTYYILRTHKRTKTSMILLPMLGGNYDDFAYSDFFINAYLEDDKLHLLYRYFKNEKYDEFEERIKQNKYYLKTLDPSNNLVVYVLSLPNTTQVMHDVSCFKEGKYSKIYEATKKKILSFHKLNKETELWHILYKTDTRRMSMSKALDYELTDEHELWDIVDLNEEKLVL